MGVLTEDIGAAPRLIQAGVQIEQEPVSSLHMSQQLEIELTVSEAIMERIIGRRFLA
jgi:hypothetical protein